MTLENGDYKAVEKKVIETLEADTGSGGLFEAPDPPVNKAVAGDLEKARALGQAFFPALVVRVAHKSESNAGHLYSAVKTFRIVVTAVDRGMDLDLVYDSVRKISARVEAVLRDQTATDKQFLGLPDSVDGAEGVLVCEIKKTAFDKPKNWDGYVAAAAMVEADLTLPCAYRYE